MALAASGATGCYVSDPQPVYAAPVAVEANGYADGSPDLVEVSPGVQVIADYDEPVFFNSGFYWRFNDGYWYSSTTWGGGWGRNYNPPGAIIHIDHPGGYAHYRPVGWHPRAGGSVGYRGGAGYRGGERPQVRTEQTRGDGRGYAPARSGAVQASRPAPAPAAVAHASSSHASASHKK